MTDRFDTLAKLPLEENRPTAATAKTLVGDWFNTRWLGEPIGHVPAAEYEAHYYEQAGMA